MANKHTNINESILKALKDIIEHVEPGRPRGYHIYPTHLRDNAIGALLDNGIEVKTYNDCLKSTKFLEVGIIIP